MSPLVKEAVFRRLWRAVEETFKPELKRERLRAEGFLESDDPGKWDQFPTLTKNPGFVRQLAKADGSDKKLVQHAKAMYGLQHGKTVANVEGTTGKIYDVRKAPSGKLACTCNDWRFRGSVSPGYECKHIQAYKQGKTKVGEMSGMGKQMSSFFDELYRLEEADRAKRTAHRDPQDTERPYSSVLTQDEEPSDYVPRPAQSIEEPEVILGGYA